MISPKHIISLETSTWIAGFLGQGEYCEVTEAEALAVIWYLEKTRTDSELLEDEEEALENAKLVLDTFAEERGYRYGQ